MANRALTVGFYIGNVDYRALTLRFYKRNIEDKALITIFHEGCLPYKYNIEDTLCIYKFT